MYIRVWKEGMESYIELNWQQLIRMMKEVCLNWKLPMVPELILILQLVINRKYPKKIKKMQVHSLNLKWLIVTTNSTLNRHQTCQMCIRKLVVIVQKEFNSIKSHSLQTKHKMPIKPIKQDILQERDYHLDFKYNMRKKN